MLKKQVSDNVVTALKRDGYYTITDGFWHYVYTRAGNFVGFGTTEARAWYDVIFHPSARFEARRRLVAIA